MTSDPVCDRCNRLASHHVGPRALCPFESTFRHQEPDERTREAVNVMESIRVTLAITNAAEFSAWLGRTLRRLAEIESDGEEWKRS